VVGVHHLFADLEQAFLPIVVGLVAKNAGGTIPPAHEFLF
jgi:hypothetical protein